MTISVSAQDLMTTVRNQMNEITDLKLALASAQRQLVEAQAALAAVKKEEKADAPQPRSEG